MLVGERGPEIVRFNRGGSVTPNGQTGGGSTFNLNLNGASTKTIQVQSKAEALNVVERWIDDFGDAIGVSN